MITGMDASSNLLEKMLNVSTTKHKVIANNIANVNTPGYKRMEVSFEDQLSRAIQDAPVSKLVNLQPKIVVSKDKEGSGSIRNDGNNVNIDSEVTSLVRNTLSYNIYTQLLGKKMDMVKSAIDNSKV
ncbi:MAG: flagellar basal body rod protein FlgB [Planctomycetes bacterium]|nr:flagellar basal body rod protein FlgB [Planctomycetota bacterium]